MKRALMAVNSAALALTIGAAAQSRPDFSGAWTYNAALSPASGQGGASTGPQITWPTTLDIKQTPTHLEVQTSTRQQHTQSVAYPLDGSETTVRGAGDITTRSVAVWDGNTLVITSRRSYTGPQGEITLDLKEIYSLVGGNLRVDRTETQEGKSTTRNVVYSKGSFGRHAVAPARADRRAAAGPIPRLPNGRPNLQGYWNGDSSASWSVEAHQAGFGLAGGTGVIIDPPSGEVPYQPWAAAERERRRNDLYNDPEPHCFPSGVPRQMSVGMPYQILQTDRHVLILFEYVHARRIIPMNRPHTSSRVRFWQGDSVGHWEGDTLVVDSDHFTDKTWLDMDGNFFSERGHVVERLTLLDANTIEYRATIEDASVFTRPWTIRFLLQRETNPDHQILEAACHEDNRDLEHIKAAYEKGIK
jgi:hypothetical protein